MEEIFSALPYYYSIKGFRSNTVRYFIRLTDPIDGDALRKAVDMAIQRYPYLKVKVVKTCSKMYLEPNDAPIAVLNQFAGIDLGGEEANGHLLAISYWEDIIAINNFHGLVDGRGRGPFLKSLMYYYCTYRYGVEIKMDDVNMADSPVDPAEMEDPFRKPLPKGVKLKMLLPESHPMKLDKMGLVEPSVPFIRCIGMDEATFIKWCKTHDATPNSAIAILMARAVKKVHPDSKKPIVAGVCCDMRAALNAPKTHLSMVHFLHLKYDDVIDKMPFDDQCTVFRGQLLVDGDVAEVRRYTKFYQRLFKLCNCVPIRKFKELVANFAMDSNYAMNTFSLSYTGKVSYGDCDKYILEMYSAPNAYGSGIMMELTCANGSFLINFAQEWKNDVYLNAFLDELKANGLDAEIRYSLKAQVSNYVGK